MKKFNQAKHMLFRHVLILLGVMVTSVSAFAQQAVSGTVTDANGETVIGATVMVKGTTNGAATDMDGKYALKNVPADATIVFSSLGYKTVEEKVNGRSVIDVVMSGDQQLLDEVVVVGYSSLGRRELTSSIVQVDKDQFQQGGMNNVMEMLTGKVAGLNVSTVSPADPNSSSSLQVRGATSLTASNEPLIVIDGVAGGDIRTIAPQDIESMTVLKDAASAAIYGTRGANGVILITTKKGSGTPGKPVITYDSYFAVNLAKGKPEVLSADEWRRSRRGNDYGASTDWYDLLMRDFSYDTNQYVSIDGSTENGYYNASINYKRATGLDIISEREEYGARASVQQMFLDKKLQLTFSLNARHVKEDWGDSGLFDTALSMNPTIPVYDENGDYYQPTSPTGVANPVGKLNLETSQGNRTYILGTADAKWNIWSNGTHSINTQVSYSYDYNDLKSDFYTPSNSSESYWNGYAGRASITYQKWWTNRIEWLGNYFFNNNGHDVKLMVGYTYERDNWEQMFMQNNNFTFDNALWHGIGSGSYLQEGKASMYAGKSESTLVGFFGRVN